MRSFLLLLFSLLSLTLVGCVTETAPAAAPRNIAPETRILGKWQAARGNATISFAVNHTVTVTREDATGQGIWAFENGEFVATINTMATSQGEPVDINDPVAHCTVKAQGQLVLKNAGAELVFFKIDTITLEAR